MIDMKQRVESMSTLQEYARLPCWDRLDVPWKVPGRNIRRRLAEATMLREAETLGTAPKMHVGHMMYAFCRYLDVEPTQLNPDDLALMDSEVFLDEIVYKLDQHKRPLWRLDETCAQALMDTDPPFDEVSMADLSSRLKLPYPALILAMPPLFSLHDSNTGEHPIEAIYLAEDEQLVSDHTGHVRTRLATWVPGKDARPDSEPGITVYALGRCKGLFSTGPDQFIFNDTHHRMFLNAGSTPDGGPWSHPDDPECCRHGHARNVLNDDPRFRDSMARIVRIVLNFLLALNAGYLEQVKQPGTTKKNPAKITAEARRGVVTRPHTLIRLGGRKYTAARASQTTSESGPSVPAFVRGHWHCYWMSDAEDNVVLGEKDGKHGPLYKVAKWIFPFQRGAGTPTGPNYKVRS